MKAFSRQACSLSDSLHSCRYCCARRSRHAGFSGAAKRRVELTLASNLHAAPTPKNNSISLLIPPAKQAIYLSDFSDLTLIFPAVELRENKYGSVKYQNRERKVKTDSENDQQTEDDEEGNIPFIKNSSPRYVF